MWYRASTKIQGGDCCPGRMLMCTRLDWKPGSFLLLMFSGEGDEEGNKAKVRGSEGGRERENQMERDREKLLVMLSYINGRVKSKERTQGEPRRRCLQRTGHFQVDSTHRGMRYFQ